MTTIKNPFFLLFILTAIIGFSGCEKSQNQIIKEPVISIAAVGDVNFGSDYPSQNIPDKGSRDFFSHCKKIIKSADIGFCNLETVICNGGSPAKNINEKNTFVFRSPPEMVKVLLDAGFDVVSIANNHIMDFGVYGLQQTKKILKDNQIQYVSADGEIAQLFVKGTKICFTGFSFSYGKRSITNYDNVFREIEEISKNCDILVVSFHAGAEGVGATRTQNKTEIFCGENRGNSVLLAHGAIDSGADLILMHGPHVPRAIELYKGKLIAYSLGNFVNYGWTLKGETKIAPLFLIELYQNGTVKQINIHSFIQQRPGYPEFDRNNSAFKLIKKLTEADIKNDGLQFKQL